MIIANLIGGLGNQLFQYAAGRTLALRHGVELKINTLGFESYALHAYALNRFGITAQTATAKEVNRYMGRIAKLLDRLEMKPYYRRRMYCEQSLAFDANFQKAPDDTLLYGYWQSEKYFKDVERNIRQEFTVATPPTGLNAEMTRDIQNSDSISIHIRRGDYVSDARSKMIHGTCDLEYYRVGIEQAAGLVSNPVLYVFTDDPSWAKENLRTSHPMIVVDHNQGDKSFEDLRLMSLCKHQVIANSTFSWWAAWLNRTPGKVVFAPRQWFSDPTRNASDLVPSDWRRI